mmetsp:Transcript_9975/g.15328  ORF Transcript_9975/g.15328 Transcript_9975/m.15328 type:complete len:91 (+) Transcript_9975:463-735(+)
MGDIWIPDRPVNVEELRLVFQLLEEDWKAYQTDLEGQKQTGLTAIIFITGFFAALCGEEIVRVDLAPIWEPLCCLVESNGKLVKSSSANH